MLRSHAASQCLKLANRRPVIESRLLYRIGSRDISASSCRLDSPSQSCHSIHLSQEEPFERIGTSSRAFQKTAKPDYPVDAQNLSYTLSHFGTNTTEAFSLNVADGELFLQDDTAKNTTKIPGRWLRDNCSCSLCRNTDTAQRQINVFKGRLDCTVAKCEQSEEHVTVTFGDGHQGEFPTVLLLQRRGHHLHKSRHGIVPLHVWGADVGDSRPSVSFDDMRHEGGMGSLLHNIRTWGFCIVEGTPATPEATEALLQSIGPIRNTHYGGFYDFTADLSSKDTAYTNESLEPHTDNTYFTEPAGLQALHMLSHTDGSGGESSLVDGFGAALQLFVEDREAYRCLSETGVYAHASGNEGISIQPSQAYPTFTHDPEHGFLTQVRWNNADRAGIAAHFAELDKWYDAAAKYDALLNDPKNQYWFQLKPGQLLIFDNWRCLHGRSAFTGKRRMCGGYINRDDFISRYRMTNMSAEEARRSTVTG